MKNYILCISIFLCAFADNKTYAANTDSIIESKNESDVIKMAREYIAKSEYDKAVMCLEEAAQQGHTEAQNFLGILYYDGEGITEICLNPFGLKNQPLMDVQCLNAFLGLSILMKFHMIMKRLFIGLRRLLIKIMF